MQNSMIHPYTGALVRCGQLDGEQHELAYPQHVLDLDDCDQCEYPMLTCSSCDVVVSCCPCGSYHAIECDWPL